MHPRGPRPKFLEFVGPGSSGETSGRVLGGGCPGGPVTRVVAVVVHVLLPVVVQALPILGTLEVSGNQLVSAEKILSSSGLRVGQLYSPADVAQAVRGLYRLGLFSQIEVEEERVGEVCLLVLRVTELPIVSAWTVEGNRVLKREDFEKAVTLEPGGAMRPQRLFESERQVLEAYHDRGYLLAQVEIEQRGDGPAAELVLKVEEGERIRIKAITVDGNAAFTDAELRKKMKTKPKGLLRSGRFEEEKFEADLDRIVEFYRNKGYLDARVRGHETTYSPDGKWMHVKLKVSEGPRYTVGAVSLEGNTPSAFPTEQLRELVSLQTGEVFRQEKLDESLTSLYERYQEEGYIFASVEPERESQSSRVDLRLSINEGPQAKVQEIVIAGNTSTKEKVIRRELVLFPGDTLRRSLLMRSQREVYNLGYFDDVGVDFEKLGGRGDVKVIFRVKEKERGVGQFNFGSSYSSASKLTGLVTLAHPNIMGNGWRGNVQWEFGKYTMNYELGLTEPWFLDTPTSVGFDIYRKEQSYYYNSDIDEVDRRGADIEVGRAVPGVDFLRAQVRYSLQDVAVAYAEGVEGQDCEEGLISSIRLNLLRDSRDNFLDPTTGSRTLVSTTLAGKMLGGDVAYRKHIVQTSWYFPLRTPLVLVLQGNLGAVAGFGKHDAAPSYERFRPGGTGIDGRVRGYEDYSLGPIDDDGNAVGGRACLTLGCEVTVPVVDQIRLLGFFDAGDAWDSFSRATPSDLKKGIGLGIRVDTGVMGVLGFDYAYGFDRAGGPRWEPHFQFGTLF